MKKKMSWDTNSEGDSVIVLLWKQWPGRKFNKRPIGFQRVIQNPLPVLKLHVKCFCRELPKRILQVWRLSTIEQEASLLAVKGSACNFRLVGNDMLHTPTQLPHYNALSSSQKSGCQPLSIQLIQGCHVQQTTLSLETWCVKISVCKVYPRSIRNDRI